MKKFLISAVFVFGFLNFSFLAEAKDTFQIRLLQDVQNLDWNVASTTHDVHVIRSLMDGLFELDEKLGLKPKLAKSYSVSSDLKTYTFKIRDDVRWSDGVALEAQHFVDSWNRLLAKETMSPNAYLFEDLESVTTSGKTTVVAKLKKPVGFFLQLLTFWITFPIRKDLITKYGSQWTSQQKLVVLGQYLLENIQPQSHITLKKNPQYYGAPANYQKVVMRIIPDNSTAINLFKSGQLDFVNDLSYAELGADAKSQFFKTAPYLKLVYLGLNNKKAPFNNLEVRKAVAAAIDRSKIPLLYHGTKESAYSIIPTTLLPTGVKAHAQPVQANGALKNPVTTPLVLVTDNSEEFIILSQFIQQELKKNLGLTVTISSSDFKTFNTKVKNGEFHLFIRKWGADYPDMDTFTGVFLSQSGNNYTGWKNTEYDKLVTETRALSNGPKRKSFIEKTLAVIRNEAPVVPMYFDRHQYLIRPEIKGFRIDQLNYLYF